MTGPEGSGHLFFTFIKYGQRASSASTEACSLFCLRRSFYSCCSDCPCLRKPTSDRMQPLWYAHTPLLTCCVWANSHFRTCWARTRHNYQCVMYALRECLGMNNRGRSSGGGWCDWAHFCLFCVWVMCWTSWLITLIPTWKVVNLFVCTWACTLTPA